MQIINPATEEIIKEITEDSKESLHGKFELLRSYQPAWQKVPLAERVNVLMSFSNLLEKSKII